MNPAGADSRLGPLATAAALALAAAVSLGLARFSYALLLPTMRADLGSLDQVEKLLLARDQADSQETSLVRLR